MENNDISRSTNRRCLVNFHTPFFTKRVIFCASKYTGFYHIELNLYLIMNVKKRYLMNLMLYWLNYIVSKLNRGGRAIFSNINESLICLQIKYGVWDILLSYASNISICLNTAVQKRKWRCIKFNKEPEGLRITTNYIVDINWMSSYHFIQSGWPLLCL